MKTIGILREKHNFSPSSRSVFNKKGDFNVMNSPDKKRFDTHQAANSFYKSPSKIPNSSTNKGKILNIFLFTSFFETLS